MARRLGVGFLLCVEGTRVYLVYIQRYHELLEDVFSLWAVPAASSLRAQLSTPLLNWTSTSTYVTSRLCSLFYVPQTPPPTITQLISTLLTILYDETGYLGSPLPTSKKCWNFSNLLLILVALHTRGKHPFALRWKIEHNVVLFLIHAKIYSLTIIRTFFKYILT